jgi:hypothetical protein
MPSAVTTPPHKAKVLGSPLRRRLALGLIVFSVFVVAAALLWRHWWPFEQPAVIENLHEASDSQVHARAFHRTFFPSPGCVLDGVVFVHGKGALPLITIDRLTIRGSYAGILARHISQITAEGMHVMIPAFGTGEALHTTRSSLTIGQIVANGATLEVLAKDASKAPLRFEFHEAVFSGVGWKDPLNYRVKLHNPNPPGEITAEGKFGVWNQSDPARTAVSGKYTFTQADLSIYRGIAGTLSSEGEFGGSLEHIDISGSTDTPNFEVTMGGHPVHLKTEFSAYVDATHGNTFLKRVDAQFRKTRVVAKGSIAKSANDSGKTARIELGTNNGRIEDLLGLFVKKERAPMSGAVSLRATVEIPPGDEPFLKKITLNGKFGIGGGEFTAPATQEGVDKLSAGARGEKESADPETVVTDLTGQVNLENGVAQFSDLSFGVPGARSRMHGTYNVINHKIDLRGQMRVDTKISNTTTGAKAFLLKMMDPFFKKKKKGEVLPVKISGTYERPTFGLDLGDKNAQVAPRAKGH